MWKTLDVFVFTLGLTEGWRSKLDGAVYPLASAWPAARWISSAYQFHNYTADETVQAMSQFLARLKAVNPNAKVILTVSPVPLAATYEDKHVLVSTTYSKAVLRVAAEQLAEGHDWRGVLPVLRDHLTGSDNRGAYFDEDLRTVDADRRGARDVALPAPPHRGRPDACRSAWRHALQGDVGRPGDHLRGRAAGPGLGPAVLDQAARGSPGRRSGVQPLLVAHHLDPGVHLVEEAFRLGGGLRDRRLGGR